MTVSDTGAVAKVFTGIRDVAIYIGESSPGKRWWGGPWRPIEWAAIVVIGGPTWWIVAHSPAGTTLPELLTGVIAMTVVVVGMRLFLPRHRPSLAARALFAFNTLRPPAGVFDRPKTVAGNLVYTKGGVYAEYLFDGVSTALDSENAQADAARLTRNLGRYLPSGFMLRGLLVPEDTMSTVLAMIGKHQDKPEWIKQCRRWEPIIANPGAAYDIINGNDIDPTDCMVPARQRFWLSIPVDCGTTGRTRLAWGMRVWEWLRGRDPVSDESVKDYAATAEQIVSGLPAAFNITPATPAQIGWYWRHRATLGVTNAPMPDTPDVMDAGDFWAVDYDEGDNHDRPWWRPSRKPYVRVGDSFQTFLTVEHFPKTGIRFPRSYYLHTLLRLDTPAVIEWTQHHNVRTPDEAQSVNRRKKKNIRDQIVQRGPYSETNNELFDKLDGTDEYGRELDSTPAERELDHAVIIAVGAADPAVLDDAVTLIRQELDTAGIVVARRKGAQAMLAKAFYTGSENQAPLDEFRNPTTAHLWSLFLPFITGWVGDTKGSPMAVDQSTAHPAIIFNDPEGAARRNQPTGTGWVGDPGGGKSNAAKVGGSEVVMRGGRVVVFEPDTIGEWAKAFIPFTHLGIRFVDPATSAWCFDTLLMYPGEQGRRLSADHVLPWIGLPDNHPHAKRYRRLLRDEMITSHQALMDHLRGLAGAETDELLDRLATAEEDFPAFFNPDLPVYRPDESAATVYLTGNLDLPDADEISNEHLFAQMKTKRRTGMAIYGLLIEIEQLFMFSRSDRYDLMIFEECDQMCAYPAGARVIHLITKRGRKHATGIWLITQDFRAIQRANDKFIRQKRIFRITDRDLAFETLKWAGFDVTGPNDSLVTELCENTSPPNRRRKDTDAGEAGAVDPWRRGEGFTVDAAGRRTRCQFLQAPSKEQADAFDSTPLLEAA